ncbi:UNVERIFIED_CONTAM: hypothetical protein NCL1_17513 [Trichonephila clavipes]
MNASSYGESGFQSPRDRKQEHGCPHHYNLRRSPAANLHSHAQRLLPPLRGIHPLQADGPTLTAHSAHAQDIHLCRMTGATLLLLLALNIYPSIYPLKLYIDRYREPYIYSEYTYINIYHLILRNPWTGKWILLTIPVESHSEKKTLSILVDSKR